MSISLDTIKDLRARGASIQMQDDLASFLQGGYDSELFMPTIDFILMLKNQAKSQGQEQEQEQSVDLSNFDIPKVYDPSYFDKISIKAAGELIKGAQIEQHKKEALLAYLDNMDIQRAKHLGLLGADGQEIAQGQGITRRANISAARKKDRGTSTIKSMFESIVTGLNALQVSVTSAAARQKQHAQEHASQQSRLKEILQRGAQNTQSRTGKNSNEDKIAKASRKFLKAMRKALRLHKNSNDDGNNSDSQRQRVNTKDVFEQKNGKPAAASILAHEDDHNAAMIQALASKAIDDAKKKDKATKGTEEEKPGKGDKNRTKEVQTRLQRNRLRRQFMLDDAHHNPHSHMTEEMHHRAESDKRVDDLTAEKAVKHLQNMGVSLGDASTVKSNKDLDALAKTQDKQRGS